MIDKVKRLKIKDNVDLKSLSKYGIEECDDEYYTMQFEYYEHFICAWINKVTRIIELEVTSDVFAIPGIIYHLVKDDLVEEVD